MNFDSEYSVEVTRSDDGVTLMSCVVLPSVRTDLPSWEVPNQLMLTYNICHTNEKVQLNRVVKDGICIVRSTTGVIISKQEISQSKDIIMPNTAGTYFLEVVGDEYYRGEKLHKVFKVIVL